MQQVSVSDPPRNLFADYISRADFCEQAGITKRTAELYAHSRRGPKVTLIAGRAYYHKDDVQAWLDSLRNTNARRSPKARSA